MNPQAERLAINRTLFAHRVSAGVPARNGAVVSTPAYTIYRIARLPGVRVADVLKLRPELEETISELRRCKVPLRFDTNPLALEVPRAEPKPLTFDKARVDNLQPFTGVLGRSYAFGQPVEHILDLTDPNMPHAFIAGQTGSGKTTLMQSALLSLAHSTAPARLHMYLIDLKNSGLATMGGLPHVAALAADPGNVGEAEAVIRHVYAIMQDRNRSGASPEPRIVLAIDELRELKFADPKILDDFLSRIVSLGRERGVHVLAATQKPLASEIGSIVKSQFPLRICGSVADGHESQSALGRKNAGAELLPGKGAMLLALNGAEPIRIQSYLVDPALEVARVQYRWPYPVDKAQLHSAELSTATAANAQIAQYAEQARDTFIQYFDAERQELKRGGKTAIIRSLFGENANTGGSNLTTADQVITYLITTTTSDKSSVFVVNR